MLPDLILLDGSTSDCAWGNSRGAITPGIFGPATNPTLTRNDFVTNSNDSSWLTNPAAPITGEPLIYGTVDTERSLRTRLGIQLIDGRLAGIDGLGAPKFTVWYRHPICGRYRSLRRTRGPRRTRSTPRAPRSGTPWPTRSSA